ncbi:MAG: P-loop NTPase fold protein [Breoghania sp.]|nr:P-loop NTPase fold protein [Breoghania sp.]
MGLILSGLTGISVFWAIGALFTESIRPGTNTLAGRLSLGAGDPFERFRKHFYETMERVRRLVLVVVDDLDRCKPEFIVDLVRGMQTLLRSPRVVFVVLGDRDWIERVFEVHHDKMKDINVGSQQTFGSRFV